MTREIIIINDSKESRVWVKKSSEKSLVLNDVAMHVFHGATLYILCENGTPLSYHVCYFGKKKKNVWEPYTNWYTAYTPMIYRRLGYATLLANKAREVAVSKGCVRLKSKAGTRLGVYLHASLGDEFWGITEKLEVVIDTPLLPNTSYQNRIPPNAVKGIGTKPWNLEKVLEVLGNRRMPYE